MIGAYYISGESITPSEEEILFLSPPVSVFVEAGQVVYISASVELGTGLSLGEGALTLGVGFIDTVNPDIQYISQFNSLAETVFQRDIYTLSAVYYAMESGVYTFGMAGHAGAPNWQGGFGASTTVLVIQPEAIP